MALHQLHHTMAAVLKDSGAAAPPNGPKPNLHNATMVELAGFLARLVEPHVPSPERATWRRLVELAGPVREVDALKGKVARELDGLMKGYLDGDALPVNGTSPTLAVALLLAVEAGECRAHGSCGKATRHAAVYTSRVIGSQKLVPLLDAELSRLDAVTQAQKQKLKVPQPIAATLWRGTSGVKTTHWLVRLADDTFGLISKTRGKWVWSQGARDDVLATVPDALMPEAVAAVMGGMAKKTVDVPSPVVIDVPGLVDQLALTSDGKVVLVSVRTRTYAWHTHDGSEAALPKKAAVLLAQTPAEPPPKKDKSVMVRGQRLNVDRDGIQAVVQTKHTTLVSYHQGKRVAVFDAKGTQQAIITARELGESIEVLHPLRCGLVLGYATWPKGTVAIIDEHARTRTATRLGKFYTGVRRRFADVGSAAALALSGPPTGSKLVVFRF